MLNNNKPINELTSPDQILAEFKQMLYDARDHAGRHLERAAEYRAFLNESQYLKKSMDVWVPRKPKEGEEWIPRVEGIEMRQVIDNLVPQIVRSRPEIIIDPEDADSPIDLREIDEESGELIGGMSDLPADVVAEAATEILEGLRNHQGRIILDRNIAEESLITGMSSVGFRFNHDHRGKLPTPRLIEPGNLLLDPECQQWWDFEDCLYTIECNRVSGPAIKHYYGVDERDINVSSDQNTSGNSYFNSFFGRVSSWWNRDTNTTEYSTNYYDVYTVYVRNFVGLGDIDAFDAPETPPMMKYTFIGENYYVADKTRENPWWHKSFPYVNFQSAPNPFSQWGVSEVAKNMGTQMALNIARNRALAAAMRNSNLPWLAEEDSVMQWNLSPGGITRLRKGSIDRVMQSPSTDVGSPAAIWEALAQNIRETQGDAQGLLQGAQPGNIRSGAHASVVLNAVLTKSGLRVLMLDPSWQRLARLEMSNLQQYIEFDVGQYLQTREFAEVQGLTESLRNLRYDVNINSKDAMPSDPVELLQLMMVLYQNGLIDAGEFYEHVKLDLSPEFRERIEEFSNPDTFIPGLPPQVQAEAQLAGQQQVQDIEGAI